MTREVSTGLIGAGYMAKVHSVAYSIAGQFFDDSPVSIRRTVIADVDRESAVQGAKNWGWESAVADWREVVSDPGIELVDIVTPNDSHHEIVMAALERGKHVLCEKPLALSASDAAEMCRAATSAGVVHQIGFIYRQWPAVQMARRLIDQGGIGKIRTVNGRFLLDYNGDANVPMSWRFRKREAGAGALADVGSHIIDLLQHLIGPIGRVSALSQTFIPSRQNPNGEFEAVDVDDQTQVLCEFESGATGTVTAGWAATGHKCDLAFEIIGENGSVAFSWQRCNELLYYDASDAPGRQGFRTIFVGPDFPSAGQFYAVAAQGMGYLESFVIATRQLLTNLEALKVVGGPSFLDGLRTSEVIDAISASNESRAWVDVERCRI